MNSLLDAVLLFAAAFLGGALNAVAGGGSFFSFPALLFVGISPVSANATNAVALWPGNLASAAAYRRELWQVRGRLVVLGAMSLIGGAIGALLLLRTKDETFARLIPYLLLLATVIFAGSEPIVKRLRANRPTGEPSRGRGVGVPILQLLISIYGGFFGGGMGILILAALAVMGLEDIHEMNALKATFSTLINGIAVLTFIIAGAVRWPEALVMIGGAVIGGYGGAALARHISPKQVRRFVIGVGIFLTIYFFVTS